MSAASNSKQAQARDLKHRVLTCLHKLSDRDTHSAAASELEAIARTLSGDSLPSFLSSISATDSSDKSPVRRQCLRLIAVLSEHHGNSLSPHLSKLLSAVVRRLRDGDSAVRSACVAASLAVSSHLTAPPFNSIAKPFLESLFTEQDLSTQNGAALCLAAIIEGSQNLDVGSLRRLLPRLEKLAKCDSFKAKPAILSVIGSVVGAKGMLSNCGKNVIRNLIMCLMEFLSSEDWAARKAAAEVLMKIVEVETNALPEYKASCLKTFEAKRFDKVKAVRETMNKMIEAWKEIPDLPEVESPTPESEASDKEKASDGRYPPGPKTSIASNTPQAKKRTLFANDSPASTARKRESLGSNENKTGPAMFRKLDLKKPCDSKIETVENNPLDKDVSVSKTRKPEIKRALFSENSEKPKLGALKSGSRVVPFNDDSVVVSNETRDVCNEDLSLIRNQLVQIENQQTHLLDILQRFIGSSQNGMHSLEARVHGLELALDEISFDIAVSNGRMSQNDAATCCIFPGTEFLSSKLWRKTNARISTSHLPASRGITGNYGNTRGVALESRKFRLQGVGGFIMNPLADTSRGGSHGLSEVSSSIQRRQFEG